MAPEVILETCLPSVVGNLSVLAYAKNADVHRDVGEPWETLRAQLEDVVTWLGDNQTALTK